ncbi:MAG: hypothetical protein CR966_01170, partial [Pseudomonadales bacterium]
MVGHGSASKYGSSLTRFKLAKLALALMAVFGGTQLAWAGPKDNNEGHNDDNHNTVIIGSKNQRDSNTNTTAKPQGIAIGHDAHAGVQGISIGTNTTSASSNSSIAIGGDDTDAAGDANGTYIKYQLEKNKVYKQDANGYYYEENGTKHYATKTSDPKKVKWIYNKYTGATLNDYGRWYNTEATGQASVAVGVKSKSLGDLSTAFGTGAIVENGATGGLALGVGAHSSLANAVAIGAGSDTDAIATKYEEAIVKVLDDQGNETGEEIHYKGFQGGAEDLQPGDYISFGKKNYERQLKNVAAGRVAPDSTDAINGSQLVSLGQAMTKKVNEKTQTYFHFNDGTGTQNSGDASTNLGSIREKAGATGKWAVTAGVNAQAKGQDSVAIGHDAEANNVANYSSIAVGSSAKALSHGSVAIGRRAKTTAGKWEGVAIGSRAFATNDETIAIGSDVEAKGARSIVIGHQSGVKNGLLTMPPTRSDGDFSVAIGSGTGRTTKTQYAADADGKYSIVMGTDARSETTGEEGVAIG